MSVYQIGRNLFASEITTPVAAIGTAYDAAKIHTHTSIGRKISNAQTRLVPHGQFEAVYAEVSAIAGATKLTLRVCADSGGDVCVIGDVEVNLDLGVSTATKGTVQIKVDVPFLVTENSANLYVFAKVDAGSCQLEKTQLSWSL